MGNCTFQAEGESESTPGKCSVSSHAGAAMSKNHFQMDYVIGRGGFGKVWRVQRKKDSRAFAMKEMSKSRIIVKKSIHSVINEQKLLMQLKHPYEQFNSSLT